MPRVEADRVLRASELTMTEYEALANERTFVLPVGILEEHGPHLPLGTDIFQVEAVVDEAAARTGSVVLPTLNYGNCHSTRNFPGSISITFDTLRSLMRDVFSELARHGVKSVVVVSGHAGSGHMRAIKQAGREAVQAHEALDVALLSEWDVLFGHAGETVDGALVPERDGHAGTMETARMMDLREDLVEDPPGAHIPPDEGYVLSPTPEQALPDGYIGDPSQATKELGRILHELAVDALGGLFEEVEP